MADEQTPPEELIIQLRKSVSLGGEVYSELKLCEPTAAQWMLWDKLAGIEADVMAVSAVSGVPLPAVRQIGARDLVVASRFLSYFLS